MSRLPVHHIFLFTALAFFQLALIQLLANILPQLQTGSFIDYQVYQDASYRFLLGDKLYLASESGMPFLYPPVAAAFLSLFVLIAGSHSIWLFTAASLASLLASVWLLLRCCSSDELPIQARLKQVMERHFVAVWLLVSAAVLQTFPVKFTLSSGQINHFVLLFISLTICYMLQKRNLVAYICTAVAISFKVYPVVLVLPLVFTKQWRAVAQVTGMLLLPHLLLLPHTLSYIRFISQQLQFKQLSSTTTAADQSLSAVLLRLNIHPSLVLVLTLAVALLYGVFLWKQRRAATAKQLLLTLPLIVILATPVWSHQLVLLYPFFLLSAPTTLILLWPFLAAPLPVSESQSLGLLVRASLLPTVLLTYVFRVVSRPD